MRKIRFYKPDATLVEENDFEDDEDDRDISGRANAWACMIHEVIIIEWDDGHLSLTFDDYTSRVLNHKEKGRVALEQFHEQRRKGES